MKNSARLIGVLALVLSAATPCRGIVAVTWLAEPTVLWIYGTGQWTQNEPLDLNGDGFTDYVFQANPSSVGVGSDSGNQYLVRPTGGNDIGGPMESLPGGFEIGPNSGEDELDWFGENGEFNDLITCLEGSGGYTCVGGFPRSYMGVEFNIAGNTHYGWIDLFASSDSPYAEIYGWGYETDPGVGIPAGAGMIPEPATSALLAVGSLLLALRRRKIMSHGPRDTSPPCR